MLSFAGDTPAGSGRSTNAGYARVALVCLSVAAVAAGQLLFDAKVLFGIALAFFFGGLATFGVAVARPLRRLVPPATPEASARDPFADGAPTPPRATRVHEALAFGLVMAVAAFFRLFRLDTIPPGFNHDSAFLSIYPIELLRGAAPLTPYFVTPSHYPIGYETFQPLVTAFYIWLLGIVPLASKLSSATSSLAALVVLYFLLRYLFGQRMALVTSFLGAVCAWHFIFGRVGWHCIAVPLWETIAVFLMLAGIRSRKRALFALAGAATAVNLMTYSISRLLLVKEAMLAGYLWIRGTVRTKLHARGLLAFIAAFVLCSLPVIHYAATHWEVFQGRARMLLISRPIGESGVSPLVENLKRTVLNLNYRANGNDFFIDAPLLDFPLSLLFAIGFVICLVLADRPRYGVVLLWFAGSMIPGLLSAPNPNHNMGALFPALILAGVAADCAVDLVRYEAARLGRAARWGAAVLGLCAASSMIYANIRSYIDPRTRRDLWGFYPETRVVGEYMRGILDRYDVYVANNYPIDTLIFLTYRGGEFVPAFHHLWNDGAKILTLPLEPPAGKGVAFIAKPEPANDPIFRGLPERFPGAQLLHLRETINPQRPENVIATVVLIEPASLRAEVKVLRAPPVTQTVGPTAPAGGRGTEPGQFDEIMGVAVGPAGAIYAADMHNDRVQKLSPDGRTVMTIGHRGTGDGEFNEPRDVAVDGAGNLYVVDSWNARVQKFDPEGHFIASFRTARGLFGPKGAAVDGDRLLVTDTGNGAVEVFDLGGRHLATWGAAGDGPGQFREPVGIAADGRGHVFVADTANGRIQKLDSDGRPLLSWPIASWGDRHLHEAYLACDGKSSVFVAEPSSGSVLRYSEDGKPISDVRNGLNVPTGLAFRGGDELVVSERGSNRVQVLRVEPEPGPARPKTLP
jgi:sugar lactone lactonase YvrE